MSGNLDCGNPPAPETKDTTEQMWSKLVLDARRVVGEATVTRELDRADDGAQRLTISNAEKMLGLVRNSLEREVQVRRSRDAKGKRAYQTWDRANKHSRITYMRIKANCASPTFSVRDPRAGNEFTFNQQRLHQLFLEEWSHVYRRHAENPPDIKQFEAEYGRYIPRASVEQRFLLEGHDLQQQAMRMTKSAPGFDGWTVEAVQSLTWQLWDDRARVERLAYSKGVFPSAYQHAPNVMLPKSEGDTPLRHRGVTIFSVLHRILGGAYWVKLQGWQEDWLHTAMHGARRGREGAADAWDLQADIEASAVEGLPCVGALLDYEIFV